jgi:hypothetical protein
MCIQQTLLQEIEESKRWFELEKDESTYKRDLAKRIELIKTQPKYYIPLTPSKRVAYVKQKYFRSLCCVCRDLPLFRVIYQFDTVKQ